MSIPLKLFCVALLLIPAVAADRISRTEISLNAQCGDYGRLTLGWNECFIRIVSEEELKGVTLSVKIIETGYTVTSRTFEVQRARRAEFTQLFTFSLPKNHPQGDFLMEVRIASGTVRRHVQQALGKAVYRPVTVV